MSSVFISYSREDETEANELAARFAQKGWQAWTDHKIRPGQTWADAIGTSLEEAACIVVLWSPNSISSKWVKKEARSGMHRNVLVPVLVKDAKIPEEFEHLEYANLTADGFEATREVDGLFKQVENYVTQARLQAERKRSESTSSFTTILTCVVLGLVLHQMLAADTVQKLLSHFGTDEITATAPFLLLLVLLFTVVEHWRILHVAHRENDIATLYLDIITFGTAFVAAGGYIATIGLAVPPAAGEETTAFNRQLLLATTALAGFIGLGILRYAYSIWHAHTLVFKEVRLQFVVLALGFVLAVLGIFASSYDRLFWLFVLSLNGVVAMIVYLVFLYQHDRRKEVVIESSSSNPRPQAAGSAPE